MKAIFLDRDGVVNELVFHPEQEVIDSPFTVGQFRLNKDIAIVIKQFQAAGYAVMIISNQPGIAKRQMSLSTFNNITQKMHDELAARGASLDGEYYCFHHPEAKLKKFSTMCDCRKPKPGMLLQAAGEHNLELKESWFIGDNLSDVEAGQSAGCKTILLCKVKCEFCQYMSERNVKPDFIAADILQAADIILKNKEK